MQNNIVSDELSKRYLNDRNPEIFTLNVLSTTGCNGLIAAFMIFTIKSFSHAMPTVSKGHFSDIICVEMTFYLITNIFFRQALLYQQQNKLEAITSKPHHLG